jgi:hypothetical protein
MTGPNDGAARFVCRRLKSEAYSERLGKGHNKTWLSPRVASPFQAPARDQLPRTVIGRHIPARLHLWMVQQSRQLNVVTHE